MAGSIRPVDVWCINHRSPFCCLHSLSMSEKFWQYWMLVLLERQLLKLPISTWQGCWYCCCCCWGCCCCWVSWLLCPPPMTALTAWWATSEPAPKAIPCMIIPPNPENMPPDWACWAWAGGVWAGAGAGLVAVVAPLEGDGLEALPRDPPPLGIYFLIMMKFNVHTSAQKFQNIKLFFWMKKTKKKQLNFNFFLNFFKYFLNRITS